MRIAVVVLAACGRIGFEPINDNWGDYADTLPIPRCATTSDLVVDTLMDESDGGEPVADVFAAGPTLSLREALRIAANRGGTNTILFDEVVFPTERPGVITMTGAALFTSIQLEVTTTCIDARKRGVVVQWAGSCTLCNWALGPGSLMVGLSLYGVPWPYKVDSAQIAGCRINTDGFTFYQPGDPDVVDLSGTATLGPYNVMGAYGTVNADASANASIINNWFGIDVLTRQQIGQGFISIDVLGLTGSGGALIIDDNVFAATAVNLTQFGANRVVLRRNRFGIDEHDRPLAMAPDGFLHTAFMDTAAQTVVFGPENIVTRTAMGVSVSGNTQITRNQIYDNGIPGLAYTSATPVEPPVIVDASSTRVTGTCSIDGTVELFSDLAAQGERFIGETACVVASGFAFDGTVPTGRNVTATLTSTQGKTSVFALPKPVP